MGHYQETPAQYASGTWSALTGLRGEACAVSADGSVIVGRTVTSSGDAAHIAVSAVHGMHFLLTWNCAHLANAEIFESVEAACAIEGYECPVICTPAELLGE